MSTLDMLLDGHLGGYIRGGDPGTYCPALWTWIVREYGIRSVLDIGCGEGHSTRFFHSLGCEVLGVDGCAQAIRDSVIPEHVVQHDLCDGPFVAPRAFDLVWSCEFLEHVDADFIGATVATFACAKKLAMVTHAVPGQPGHHHVNCQWSNYWIDLFDQVGLSCNVGLSLRSRAAALADHRGRNHYVRSGLAVVRDPASTPTVGANAVTQLANTIDEDRATYSARLK